MSVATKIPQVALVANTVAQMFLLFLSMGFMN
jgi:hypothetical protein